jgi:hypothetical protein
VERGAGEGGEGRRERAEREGGRRQSERLEEGIAGGEETAESPNTIGAVRVGKSSVAARLRLPCQEP